MDQNKKYLTKAQVASLFQVDPRTVFTWMKNGLPYFRLGPNMIRFDQDELHKWYEKNVVIQQVAKG